MPDGSTLTITLMLILVALSAFFSAITSFLLLIKDRELYRMFSWTLGSFSGKTWQDLFLVLPVSFISVILLFICTNPMPRQKKILPFFSTTFVSYRKIRHFFAKTITTYSSVHDFLIVF